LYAGLNRYSYVINPTLWVDALGLQVIYSGEFICLSRQASANLEYEGYRNYGCWMKTGGICRLQGPPLFDYVYCSGGVDPLCLRGDY